MEAVWQPFIAHLHDWLLEDLYWRARVIEADLHLGSNCLHELEDIHIADEGNVAADMRTVLAKSAQSFRWLYNSYVYASS